MKKLVLKYLSLNFHFHERALVSYSTNRSITIVTLEHEIEKVFGIPSAKFKPIIRQWWSQQKAPMYFKRFWKQRFIFPIGTRFLSTLVGSELVTVQPLPMPTGLLFHMDYRYDPTLFNGSYNVSIGIDMAVSTSSSNSVMFTTPPDGGYRPIIPNRSRKGWSNYLLQIQQQQRHFLNTNLVI